MWSTQTPSLQGEQKKLQAFPAKTQPDLGRSQFGDTRAAVGEQLLRRPALVRTWAPRRRGRGAGRSKHGDLGAAGRAGRAAQRRLVPRVRPGPTPCEDARDPWMASGTLRRPPMETHGHSQPRRVNREMWPQDTAPGTITLLDASGNPGVPAGGENVRIAVQLVETRPYSPRKPHRSGPAGA